MLLNALRSLWREPRPLGPKGPAWRGRWPIVFIVPMSLCETLHREALVWRPAGLLVAVSLMFAFWYRQARPFRAVLIGFGVPYAIAVAALLLDVPWPGLNTSAFVLLLIYALFRWGAGKEAAIGLGIMAFGYALSIARGELKGVPDAIGGLIVMLFPAVLGASVRFRARSQEHRLEQAKLLERERLARDLHDTVAHHVSAIAIQAQAGRAVAATRPEAALETLGVIEEAAKGALSELRAMVGALREQEAAQLRPLPGLADIERMAQRIGGRRVQVERSGDLEALRPSVDTALYRLAQESITNAVRHARSARHILVRIDGDEDAVHLIVTDDGAPAPAGARGGSGFGLVGMSERAALLGGSLVAGPNEGGGWTVRASLPRRPQ